jgi:serine/threonine protein kinase
MAQMLGRYILEHKLGAGGMAEVYLATQLGAAGFRRSCVVKRTLSSLSGEPEFLRMFFDEARLAAQLVHPHVVQIFDFGEADGSYYIAMEYIAGADLKTILKSLTAQDRFMPFPVAARLVSQTAQALDYAHHASAADGTPLNVVHRDVSPHNVLVSGGGQVKLIDFGIARAATASEKTRSGLVKGKYAYMSPEQIEARPLDGRSDLFSLGLVFYELLAGRPAVPRSSVPEIMDIITQGRIAPIQTLRPDVPPQLAALIARALAQRPEGRFARGADMADALERWLLAAGVTLSPADLAVLIPPAQALGVLSDGVRDELGRSTARADLTATQPRGLPRALRRKAGMAFVAAIALGAALAGRCYWRAGAPTSPAPRTGSPSPSASSPP